MVGRRLERARALLQPAGRHQRRRRSMFLDSDVGSSKQSGCKVLDRGDDGGGGIVLKVSE
jgi:hypothetical protein